MVRMAKRPKTATLIKPTILDTKLLGILDMSTISREHLLAIRNLVHATPRCKCNFPLQKFSNCKSDLNLCENKLQKATYKSVNKTYRFRNREEKAKILDISENLSPRVSVIPTPCVTCGRPDQPERFHSHPIRTDVPAVEKKEVHDRKTVQKPVPIKFKSAKAIPAEPKETEKNELKKSSIKLKEVQGEKNKTGENKENFNMKNKITKWKDVVKRGIQLKNMNNKGVNCNKESSPIHNAYQLETWAPAPVSGGRKRKVVCYLCSQEFGAAALPSHEAQCIKKYLKGTDNTSRRNSTEKEGMKIRPASEARENWKLAWEFTQASLVPCSHCDRKFLPNRLDAHQKVCESSSSRSPLKTTQKTENSVLTASTHANVYCSHCGKWFNSNIPQHREHVEKFKKNNQCDKKIFTFPSSPPDNTLCYICGKEFESKIVRSHEQQCLKKWLLQHENLPLNLNNSGSLKKEENLHLRLPDTPEKLNDFVEDSLEFFWKAHQNRLVPCTKCSRTFYPDRLEVHLRGCKGPSKKK